MLPSTGNAVNSEDFDITLLMILLTNLCGFTYPGPKFNPDVTDTTEFAQLFRIKRSRDNVRHKSKLSVSDPDFQRLFSMVTTPMLALGVSQDRIDNIKSMTINDKKTRAKIETLKKMEKSLKSFNFNNLPPVDNFFSREKEVEKLHNKLTKSFRTKFGVVLHGYPGLGKSETVRRYWAKYGKSHYDDIVIWINSESTVTMQDQFRQIAERCGIEEKIKKPDGTYKSIQEMTDIVYIFFSSANIIQQQQPHQPQQPPNSQQQQQQQQQQPPQPQPPTQQPTQQPPPQQQQPVSYTHLTLPTKA